MAPCADVKMGESKSQEAEEPTEGDRLHMEMLLRNGNALTPNSLPRVPPPASRIEEKMYKGQSGMWSWLLHRITGLGVLLFLLIHIVDVSILGFGPEIYNKSVLLFDFWVVRLLSLSLVGAVLFHAFNGVRIMVIDFWRKGVRYQKVLFSIVMAVTIIAFIPMAYYIIAPTIPWFFHLPTASKGH